MRKKLSGVKLAHHKNTANTASQPLPLPKRVRIPMSMHIGAPCKPIVVKYCGTGCVDSVRMP